MSIFWWVENSAVQQAQAHIRGRTMKVIICEFIRCKTTILCHTHIHIHVLCMRQMDIYNTFSTVCVQIAFLSFVCLFVFSRNRFLQARTDIKSVVCCTTVCKNRQHLSIFPFIYSFVWAIERSLFAHYFCCCPPEKWWFISM